MDRKSLILLLAGGLGCAETELRKGAFDGPHSATVLHPEGTFFEEPVGFVANSRSGIIIPIDLKHGTLLSDQFGAPFLRPRWIATGSRRLLGDIVAWAPTEDTVTVIAADTAHSVLVEAPYIVGFDGEPEVVTPTFSKPEFIDVDQSGDDPTLSNIALRRGWSTTETWTVEFDGEEWIVTGSRSGRQGTTISSGDHFQSKNREVEFDLKGKATRGDRFVFSTHTGIVEHDLGGLILALERVPGEDLVVAAVWDPILETGSIVLWDLALMTEVGRFDLPAGAQPWRMAFGETAADLFIADAHQPLVYETTLRLDDPTQSSWDEIVVDGPVTDLAYVEDTPDPEVIEAQEDLGDTGDVYDTPGTQRDYRHLFVAPAGLNRVDVYDLDLGEWIDVNPQDDSPRGISLHSPVVGLDATNDRVTLGQENSAGVRVQRKAVAVTTSGGSLLMLEGGSGCAGLTVEGPHVPITQGVESISFADAGRISDPYLLKDDDTQRRIQTHACGGVVQEEKWTLTYSEVSGSWEIEGNISGIQQGRALEDQRYVSDNGAISFTIMAGSQASSDGDSFVFYTDEGIMRINGALRPGSVESAPLELPAPPVVFQYNAGPTGGGWDELDRRTFVLLPVTNSDFVLRIRVKPWVAEVIWD